MHRMWRKIIETPRKRRIEFDVGYIEKNVS
jgi:hypothetical protein